MNAWRAADRLPESGVFIRPALYAVPERLPQLELGVSKFEPNFPLAGLGRFRAGLAAAMLAKLDRVTAVRRANAARYLARLERDAVTPVAAVERAEPAFLRLPLLAADAAARTRLVASLSAEGLGASAPYPACLGDLPALRPHLDSKPGRLPGAREVVDRLFTLPTHPFVTPLDIDRICRRVAAEALRPSDRPIGRAA